MSSALAVTSGAARTSRDLIRAPLVATPQSVLLVTDRDSRLATHPTAGMCAAMAELGRVLPGEPGTPEDTSLLSHIVAIPSVGRRRRIIAVADALARHYHVVATVSAAAVGDPELQDVEREAAAALRRSVAAGHTGDGCMPVERLRLASLLAAIPTEHRTAFRTSVFAALDMMTTRRRGTLVATLRALEATGGHVCHAALLLEVDEKTIRRRLEHVEEATGLPADCIELRLAVQLLEMEAVTSRMQP